MNEVIEKLKISSFGQNAEGVFYLLISTWLLNIFLGVSYTAGFAGALIIVALLVVKDAFRFIAEAKNEAKNTLIDSLEADLLAKQEQIEANKKQSQSKIADMISQISASEAQIESLNEQISAYQMQMEKSALQISASVSQIEFLQEAEKHNAHLRKLGEDMQRLTGLANEKGWSSERLYAFLFDSYSEANRRVTLDKVIQNSIAKSKSYDTTNI